MAPLEGCYEFLVDADLEKECGLPSGTLHGKLDEREACRKRFKHSDRKKASLVLSVRKQADAAAATSRLNGMRSKAKRRDAFATVDDLGAGAYRYERNKGKGEKLRIIRQLDFAAGAFVAELRATQHPDAKPLCDAATLPALAKVVAARLKGSTAASGEGTSPSADARKAEGPAEGSTPAPDKAKPATAKAKPATAKAKVAEPKPAAAPTPAKAP